MTRLHVQIKGLDKLKRDIFGLSAAAREALTRAGDEAGHEVIQSEGLQRYPPATGANAPPAPYYIRGRGTQLKGRNLGESERYGSQFVVTAAGLKTTIGNRASYARYLTDEVYQARAMQRIGWKKMIDVARSKQAIIVRIFEGWIARAIKGQGL